MHILASLLVGTLTFIGGLFGSVGAVYGTAITTINGSDTLSSSRTTLNTNFTALDAAKVDNATTSMASLTTLSNLATVGTISSGVWNGTKVGAQFGGTGSSTLSGILIGNGTSPVNTLTIGSNLTLTGTTLAVNTSGISSSTLLGDTNTFSGTDNFTAKVGFGTSSPVGGVAASSTAIVTCETPVSTSTSMTISWYATPSCNQQLVRIGGAAASITFSNFVKGETLRLLVCNPNGTGGALTFLTPIMWSGSTLPTQTQLANTCDVWSFIATNGTSSPTAVEIFGGQSSNYP